MTNAPNLNPEQKARDPIDQLLTNAGWLVHNKRAIDPNIRRGIAVREYQTDADSADHILFLDRQPQV